MRKILKAAVTGGIGTGKTTVCQIFNLLGVPVYNADSEAKKLLFKEDVKAKIFDAFGYDIKDENNNINKAKLASIVFKDANKLQQLNNIIHPEVKLDFLNWAEMYAAKQHKYVIMESAIIFESGFNSIIDKTIVVASDMQTRIQRVKQRDNANEQDIQNRINQQMKAEELNSLADYIIYNSNNELIIPQTIKIHSKLNK